jgi:hypothetical protein
MANTFLESLRAALTFAERAQNAELLGSFQKALLEGQDMIDANLQLREENRSLQEQIRDLQSSLEFSGQLVFIRGLYHTPDADGRIGEPYCPKCWETDKQAVHIHWQRVMKHYSCPNCVRHFEVTMRNPLLTRDRIEA